MNSTGEAGIHAESARGPVDNYHEFLSSHPQLAADAQSSLRALSISRKLTFGGEPFSRYLRPHMVTQGQYEVIKEVVKTLASAMIKLRRAVLKDEKLLDQLDLTPEETELALIDPGFEEPSPAVRLDSFWSERDWKFVEINAESPAAISYEDVLADVFLELPIITQWCRSNGFVLSPLYARPRFMQSIENTWHEFRSNRGAGFDERPSIAIVDWDDVATYSEFELFKEYFENRGYRTIITDPRRLEFRNGRLYDGDFLIDVYYKRVLTSELLSNPEAAAATVAAYKAGSICVVNSFRAKLLHKKMSLSLLHDGANANLFSEHELLTIRRHIPWTRKVAEGFTTVDGTQVDLLPYIASHREQLVLKPNDEYGGKGVAIGWASTQSEWERTISEALSSSFVVQAAVQLDRESYPFFDDDHGVTFRDLTADLDPFLFGTEMSGVLTRLSSQALLNVTAGTGSVVPTMVVTKAE